MPTFEIRDIHGKVVIEDVGDSFREVVERYKIGLFDTDLSNKNLVGADLSNARLLEADLSGTNLVGANLYEADLAEANLRNAKLTGADLSKALLLGADLSGADLRVANLAGANLSYANLSNANFLGANLEGARLTNANLEGAIGLEKAIGLREKSANIKKRASSLKKDLLGYFLEDYVIYPLEHEVSGDVTYVTDNTEGMVTYEVIGYEVDTKFFVADIASIRDVFEDDDITKETFDLEALKEAFNEHIRKKPDWCSVGEVDDYELGVDWGVFEDAVNFYWKDDELWAKVDVYYKDNFYTLTPHYHLWES